jgi:omega-amidase
MRAHLLQMDIAWEDRPANRRRARALMDRAAQVQGLQAGDLVVLPELFDTGFSFNLEKTADTDGGTLRFLIDEAARLRVTLVGSRTVLGPDGRGRNRCTVCDPTGAIVCEYDKVHPFSYGKEAEHFTGGSRVALFDWAGHDGEGARVCPTICYDLRFPELFRIGLLSGAEVFTVIANWPQARVAHRRALAVARAIENQAVVLCVNRAGNDPHLKYQGESLAVGPKGDILAEAGPEECVLSVPIDLAALRAWRAEFPAWRDIKLLG